MSNIEMGYLFEELIRRFSEISNETAGEHFTPREVIRLIVDLLIANDDAKLTGRGIIRQVYHPACGTGGMLALTEKALKGFNPSIRVELFGQELNAESFGICKSDMLVTGHDPEQIAFGNTLTQDAHKQKRFHYMLSNPPYGVDWKKYQEPIKAEAETMGKHGRFGAGTPRISDGQLLFLQHMISKMRDDETGSRIGIVMNGSPLFTGAATSGESEIRRWMIENDWVEAIVALPTDLFYNTGIQTYVWILSNRKPEHRKGRVQLIDASGYWRKMRKSLGSKRKELSDDHIAQITRLFAQFTEASDRKKPISKLFKTSEFGYRTITVERPLKDENGKIILGEKGKLKGKPQPDSSLRDTENVPLSEDVESYFKREVLPHAPDAWIDHDKTKVGYEIPFNRHFYVFEPPRELAEIDADLKQCTDRILA
ncbi:MAG: HsdM family class I SAM-dependent methyltransferase, partial [Methylococcales bacterium]